MVLCIICGAEADNDKVQCRNSQPNHPTCKNCFTNYVQGLALECRQKSQTMDFEKVKCPNEACKVFFAPKAVREIVEKTVPNLLHPTR